MKTPIAILVAVTASLTLGAPMAPLAPTPPFARVRAPLLRGLAGVFLAALAALPVSGQAQIAPPRVYVRQVRVDSLLVAFGVDSVRLRALVTEQLRDGNRLAPDPVADASAFDVDIGIGRSVAGPVDPNAWVRIEVGRNRMEAGTATRLLWKGGESLSSQPTMRATAAATTSRLVELVRAFLADRPGT